jgi:uncharacterized membrane protein
MTNAASKKNGQRRHGIRRYASVYVAAVIGIAVAGLSLAVAQVLAIELGISAFFLSYLVLVVWRLRHMTPELLRSHADESDAPGFVILAITLATVAVAVVSLFILLNTGERPEPAHMLLGIVTVLLGWFGLNTLLGFHYAYKYYDTDEASPVGKDGKRPHIGGLDFPGSDLPDALSFLYFSFVVAMTAQVSDVEVTSNAMRKLVLLHGILAFFFNTVILATAVNIVVSLGH